MCERNIDCLVASCTPSTRDLAHNPGMCPEGELNWRHFGSQAGAHSAEPHQPGHFAVFHIKFLKSSVYFVFAAQFSTGWFLFSAPKPHASGGYHMRQFNFSA